MPFPNGQRLILVVDDEKVITDTFDRAFAGQEKFIVDTAISVETAIVKVRSAFYDWIFLDMKMGTSLAGMRVLEALREVEIEQESKGNLLRLARVVIMSSAVCLDDFSQKANELDVFTFINKPVDFSPKFIRRVVNKLGLPLMPMREEDSAI